MTHSEECPHGAGQPQLYSRLVGYSPRINQQLARYGVKFGLYKNGQFEERLSPSTPSRGSFPPMIGRCWSGASFSG